MKFLTGIISATILLLTSHATADEILLQNGRTVQGRVISRSGDFVIIESRSMELRLRADSIISIHEAEPYENTLLSAENYFRRFDAARAFDELFQAQREGAPLPDIQEIILQENNAIASSINRTSEEQRGDLRMGLRRLMESDMLTTDSLFFASQHFYQLNDYEAAAAALDRLPEEAISADPRMRQWGTELMRFFVRRHLKTGEFEKALGYVEKMRRLSGDHESKTLPLAHLASAAAARESHRYRLAFKIIAQDLYPEVPEIARNRAIYTIESMKRWAAKEGKYAEARDALTPIKAIFPVEYYSAHQFQIVMEARSHLANARPKEALALLGDISPENRVGDVERLYNNAYHESRIAELSETEPLELLKHGRWLMDHGMTEEAIRVFNTTRENETLREVSDELLTTLRLQRDTQLLEAAQSEYDTGNMGEVIQKTKLIINNPSVGSQLQEEAQKLNELAQKSLGREREARPYRAEVLFQHAERSYFQQDVEESFNLLNVILTKYSDTPAAGRAADLLPDVVSLMEIAYLEGRTKTLPSINDNVPLAAIQQTDKLDDEVTNLLDGMKSRP